MPLVMPLVMPLRRHISTALAVTLMGMTVGCSKPQSDVSLFQEADAGTEAKFAVTIRQPPVPQGVEAQAPTGETVQLACSSCHSVRKPNVANARTEDLDMFHQGLQVAHGKLTCVSCHAADDGYESLRLADGTAIPFTESMQLCGQCHGTQLRDYEHGAHGGMTGHWDLSQGGRERNHCLHCHDAHSPAYPHFTPAAPPRDRFAPVKAGHADAAAPHDDSAQDPTGTEP